MNNEGKWTYRLETDKEGIWMHDTYDTKDKAIKEGIEQAKECNAKEIFVGETELDAVPRDSYEVINNIQGNKYEPSFYHIVNIEKIEVEGKNNE